MDDVADVNSPPRLRRRIWQFSLRELLLLTVIVGLAMTLLRPSSGAIKPTPFFATFDLDRLLRQSERRRTPLQPTGVRNTWSR